MATPENCTPSNNCATSNGTTINPKPVAASAMAAKASNFFISKCGDALNHPKRRDSADAIRSDAPSPRWLRDSRASHEPSRQGYDAQNRRDEKELSDFNTNIEE